MDRRKLQGIAAAAFAALCWGSATVMSKSALDEVSPIALLVIQLSASAVALWAVIAVTRRQLPRRRDRDKMMALGVLEPGLAYLLGLVGLVSIRAGDATLIQASEAIMIVLLSAILLKMMPTASFVVLSLVALCGLAIALGFFGTREAESATFGVVMVFLATATAAVYVVLSSRLAVEHDPVVLVGYQQLSALAVALLALPIEAFWMDGGLILPSSGYGWTIAIVSGLVQYAMAFSAYMYAMARISANLAGSFLNLTPVFGLGIAFVALGETLNGFQFAGAAITIAAVTFIQFRGEPALDAAHGADGDAHQPALR